MRGLTPSPRILKTGVGRRGHREPMKRRTARRSSSVVDDSTTRFYETHAREYFDRTVSADLSALYDDVLKHVKPGGRILDVGCGSGRDLKIFRARGFDAVWACASLLHLPKRNVVSILARLRLSLVEGGIVYASVQVGQGEVLA